MKVKKQCIYVYVGVDGQVSSVAVQYIQSIIRDVVVGRRGYGFAITLLSLRDISSNRGISSTATEKHPTEGFA